VGVTNKRWTPTGVSGVKGERAYAGGYKVVEALLEAGAAPNARDAVGGTPLHCAVRANCTTAASALLAAAADPAAADVAGASPLELATSSAMRELLRGRAQ
jgi:ankyrin repeat protein